MQGRPSRAPLFLAQPRTKQRERARRSPYNYATTLKIASQIMWESHIIKPINMLEGFDDIKRISDASCMTKWSLKKLRGYVQECVARLPSVHGLVRKINNLQT